MSLKWHCSWRFLIYLMKSEPNIVGTIVEKKKAVSDS